MKNNQELTYLDSEKSIAVRVEDLLSRMTIEEKIAQLGSVGPERILEDGEFSPKKAEKVLQHGIGQITRIGGAGALEPAKAAEAANKIQGFLQDNTRLGIPALMHEECLSGYMGKGGTTYPQSIGLASSWEPELLEEITTEIRKQMKAIGAHLGLSPVADVARDLRWGRVEETYGEDQYLVARMITAYVEGLQGENREGGLYATLKHFVGHSFPEGGRNHAPVNLSPRQLRENFLFPFEVGVKKAKAGSIMNAYHDIDGIPCTSSRELLTGILRGEWSFDGIVVSDYFSIQMLYTDHKTVGSKQEAGVEALEAGLDIELPEIECYGQRLLEAVEEGLISEATINQSVRRHLRAKFELGIFENRYVAPDKVNTVFETDQQRELAREAARKSTVLLKNEDKLLPLTKDLESVAVIGPSADNTRHLLGDYAYSAHVDSEEDAIPIVSLLDGIKNKVSADTQVNYARGCGIMDDSKAGFTEAVEAAKDSEVAVVAVGGKSGLSGMGGDDEEGEEETTNFSEVEFSTEMTHTTDTTGEHHDRTDLKLPGVQQELIKELQATGTPVVVVLINGRPLAVEWTAKEAPALLEAWLPGEEGGNGVADILFGDYNPEGRLPVSIPRNVGQTPINYNRKLLSANRDYVFSSNNPLFSFGYGLSYTKFEYSNLRVNPQQTKAASKVEIKVDIKNIGERKGAETVQLYLHDQLASVTRPIKELKGFKKVKLAPQEEKTVTFILSTDQLAFYDQEMNLIVEPGIFKVLIGSSADDIRQEAEFEVTGAKKEIGAARTYFTEAKVD